MASVMPYKFTRDPMYVGPTTRVSGFIVYFGSSVMLAAPIAFLVVIVGW
jgi:protein-S-isoprenylcysteine O-methyltransferase Ste14